MKGIRHGLILTALTVTGLGLGGCVVPAGPDWGAPGGYGGGNGGYQQPAPQQPQAHIVDVNGDWRFGNNVNRMQATYDGMLVTPVGRGTAVRYVEIGPNLYQDANASGTYEFVASNHAVWRSNDRRNKVIHLYR